MLKNNATYLYMQMCQLVSHELHEWTQIVLFVLISAIRGFLIFVQYYWCSNEMLWQQKK